jgi:hypothetical protein
MPRLGSSQKNRPLVPYSILTSIYQTQITAQNAIPAQNVIRYSKTPFAQRLHYIYIRVCVLYVRVRVCVCDPDMASGSLSQHSPTPVSLVKRTVCFFVLVMWLVPWIHHIIINTPRLQVCVFTKHCVVREVCILFSVSEERRVFLRYSNLISIQQHSGPGPFTCPILRRSSRGRGAASAAVKTLRILYINRET